MDVMFTSLHAMQASSVPTHRVKPHPIPTRFCPSPHTRSLGCSRHSPDPEPHTQNLTHCLPMQVREHIMDIKARLEQGLRALAGAVSGNLPFTREALGDFAPLVDPLMTSPLVGDGAAFEASLQLCRSLDPALAPFAANMAVALRLARQSAYFSGH